MWLYNFFKSQVYIALDNSLFNFHSLKLYLYNYINTTKPILVILIFSFFLLLIFFHIYERIYTTTCKILHYSQFCHNLHICLLNREYHRFNTRWISKILIKLRLSMTNPDSTDTKTYLFSYFILILISSCSNLTD